MRIKKIEVVQWTVIIIGDASTYPPPRKKIEAVLPNDNFPDGLYHFFAKRERIDDVTNLGNGRIIPLSKVIAWRSIVNENQNA